MWSKLLIVAAAGGVGSAARYLASVWMQRGATGFPIGTLAVNIVGCLAIGVLMGVLAQRDAGDPAREQWRLVIGVGLLGGFTTFSAFGYETFEMLRAGRIGAAASYIGLSVVLGLAAVWLGWSGARLVSA